MGAAAVPEFDALYLDMNGIIHNCTHGNDPSTKLTEAEMVVRTFSYLDRLVQIAKPQKMLFMAIDGAYSLFVIGLPSSLVMHHPSDTANIDPCCQHVWPGRPYFNCTSAGVAPRAKMNQQRSRRFRSARDTEEVRTGTMKLAGVRQMCWPCPYEHVTVHKRFSCKCR